MMVSSKSVRMDNWKFSLRKKEHCSDELLGSGLIFSRFQKKMRCFLAYSVMTADTGRNALSILLNRQHAIDLVMISTNLPDMCTFKLVSKVEKLMRMPVVMLCDVYDQATVIKGYLSGAMRCLVKPLWFHDIKDLWQLPIVKETAFILECSRFLMSGNVDDSHGSSIGFQKSKKRKSDELEGVNRGTMGQSSNFMWTRELNHKFLCVIRGLGFSSKNFAFDAPPSVIGHLIDDPRVSSQLVAEKLEKFQDYLALRHRSLYKMVCPNLLDMSSPPNGETDNNVEIVYKTGESQLARYLENPYSRQQLKRVINVALLKWEGETNATVIAPQPPPPTTTEVPLISVPFALALEIENFIHTYKAIKAGPPRPPGFLREVASLMASSGPSASAELEGKGEELEPGFLEKLDGNDIFDAIEELRDW